MHQLGDRVLDLEPGVHLQEPEPLGGRVVEELDRAGAAVVDRLGRRAGGVVQRGADLVAQAGRRRLLDHLLVPALDRAVAFADRRSVPTTWTSTCRPCSTYGSTKTVPSPNADAASASAAAISPGRSASDADDPHAATATAGGRLDQQREVGLGRLRRVPPAPARRRPASAPWRPILEPICSIDSGVGPTQVRPASTHGAGEVGVLGEEAVAGVDASAPDAFAASRTTSMSR